MKTRLRGALVGLAISLALPTFAQQKETVDPQLIQKLDDTLNKKYIEANNNHDASAIGALYTDDAIFVTDTWPLYGRQAIEKWYEDLFKGCQPKNHTATIDPHSVRMLGPDNLTNNGDWSETGKGKNGEDVPVKGYWSAIDTRQGDAWKICVLTWNQTPGPAATPSPTASPSNK
jgi:uncharacterized protein (TIGR02246 family)